MTIKPISPKEAFEGYDTLPPKVIETWNKLIIKNRSGRTSIVFQTDAVEALRTAMSDAGDYRQGGNSVSRDDVFKNGWLNIEEVFRAAGWKVEYDKPGYNENYELGPVGTNCDRGREAIFTFTEA